MPCFAFPGLFGLLADFFFTHVEAEEMNITYISIWGAACALGTLLDILGFIIPVATGLLQLELLPTIVRTSSHKSEHSKIF